MKRNVKTWFLISRKYNLVTNIRNRCRKQLSIYVAGTQSNGLIKCIKILEKGDYPVLERMEKVKQMNRDFS